ncbi:hypothetical protein [Ruixingdingia sedimenti]|uniref:Uncharacterized protein n=1 Tax=Ruixingdingia sedimenti TaxID=3073604 RepID=A0ABU1FD43_9RHOB|nr:hypothetical protein [Xinfangfangia sp. LG-4]MDR5654533.1 hypothetical protein [Xinfangfangia sp. LG-4]
MKDDLAIRLAEVFPTAGATASGTGLLFAGDDGPQHDLTPSTWHQVAEQINDVVDYSLISSMMPPDFRYYLPGLILGVACHERDAGSPTGATILADLYRYSNRTTGMRGLWSGGVGSPKISMRYWSLYFRLF